MSRTARTFLQGVVFGVAAAWLAFELSTPGLEPDLSHYRSVRDFARDSFVRKVSDEELLDHALHGMLSGLDTYSRYYDRGEAELLERETAGRYVGIGVVFRNGIEGGLVLFPLAGSPGDRAGVRVGDQLLEVDGRPLEELAEPELRAMIEASERSPVTLRLRGRDGLEREVSLRAESLVDPTVRHTRMLDEARGIGYAAITSFSHETPGEFDEAFEYLTGRGMQALVLDLRGNYGGVLESAVSIARRFIAEGVIVTTEGRGAVAVMRAERAEARHVGFPLVVLVDGESASASEVLAGALQDHRAAVITGSPSYGKGMVQTIRRFDDEETRAKVTSSYYYSPTHRNFERSADEGEAGITPDLVIETDESERRAVHAFLSRYSAPLGLLDELSQWERESGETLVDHPPQDAQLAAAVGLLSGERPGPYSVSVARRTMTGETILGIESSCDETAAAVVRGGREVLSSIVHSQAAEHAPFGGVVPEVAGRSHLRQILPCVDRALGQARLDLEDLDAVAVTARPGLIGSLLVGLSAAKALAFARRLPLVGVHHIEAHAYAATMELDEPPYPCLALVVSGGHTALYRADSALELNPLASTLDDAAGEAFDKVAHLLGLGYPGGPAVSDLAASGDPGAIRFPRFRPRAGQPGFSFSGLKTAVLYHLRGGDALAPTPAPAEIRDRADVAASFEAAVVDTLVENTFASARREGLERVIVAGGVACNRRLREEMATAGRRTGVEIHFPTPAYCTDNAVMIAGLGWELLRAGRVADWSLDAAPR